MNSIFNDCQPSVVLGNFFLNSDAECFFDGSFFIFELENDFFVEPSDFAKFTDHVPDCFRNIDVFPEFIIVTLGVLDKTGVNILHNVTDLANDIDFGDVLL